MRTRELFADSKGIESAEYDNHEIIAKGCLDLCKYQKFKNLIWRE
ncbi:hypothetical protein [Helicobacter sp. MIT 05-5293]|nr:hypothetical protein [Helicobacter sp. MIT 05-5293]